MKDWNERHAYPKIILSTNTRLFTEFEARYGQDLPVLSGDMTPYWEGGAASTSADLAVNRRAKEQLDQAERLWTMLNPQAELHDQFAKAWHNAIMYDEHTWGAHCSISKPFSEFTVSQEKFHPFKIIGRGRGCLPVETMMYDKTPEGVPDFWERRIDPGEFFYSWVMTNHWETNYKAFQEGPHRFEYTLLPHAEYDQAVAQRGAIEVAQPLVAFPVDSEKRVIQPPMKVNSDGIVVSSLRPARDGEATMVRLFAASGQPERFHLKWSEPRRIYHSDPQESRGTQVQGPIELPAYGVITLRVETP